MANPRFEKTFKTFKPAENVRRRLLRYGYIADISPAGDMYALAIPVEEDIARHATELRACVPDVRFTLVGVD